jgi:hypothetical protein
MKDRYIARAAGVAARALGQETILMNPKDSTFFTLNRVATAIWRAADGQSTLGQIVERQVCGEFDVDPPAALADAEEFVSSLTRHGVLHALEAPAAPQRS